MTSVVTPAIGTPLHRVDGREKVMGQARYAYEHPIEGVAYAAGVMSDVVRGRIVALHTEQARDVRGVLAVLSYENAPRLASPDDRELFVLQEPRVAYRGQYVAVVVAESAEIARHAAGLVRVDYAVEHHDVRLRANHPGFYKPEKVNPRFATDTERGDPDAALASAAVSVDATYSTPAYHNNPMEPHATVAVWEGGRLTLYDSTQGVQGARRAIAQVFGLEPEDVRVISPHVGGGFGSKGLPHAPVVVAALAARAVRRPVKLAVTRQQMFALTGYRTPTIQRVRFGADTDGRLTAIVHDAFEQSSTLKEFAEQTTIATRHMYAAPNRRTTHRLVRLDVPTPSWMRAPGECPGMYALESAMDELAVAAGIDPIELRIRNEPRVDPESDLPFSSRNLVACLREGAERFGWAERDPAPGVRRDGDWLIGTGVAASTYPAYRSPASARVTACDGGYLVQVSGADLGTGARTVLTQIAADALEVAPERVRVEIGDSDLPQAGVAGGSMGTASWGSAVHKACRALRDERSGAEGAARGRSRGEATASTAEDVEALEPYSRHAFGAQFAEVRVNAATGEVRVPRLLGVFAAGRIINPQTARSQLIGGMTMGLGMALLEESVLDTEFGDYLNHDFAQYHVPACADVLDIDAAWVEEDDPHLNPMGSKGIGEIGIVGTAAAIANAVFHATGRRVRDLPIRLDRILVASMTE
jgi:xanthine dehydrogenase YagR molybdenum-binding subunit